MGSSAIDQHAVVSSECAAAIPESVASWRAFSAYCSPAYVEQVGSDLSGLTFACKDMVVFNNRAPLCGLPQAPDLGLSGTAPVLQSVLQAGAALQGLSTMPALAYEPSGLHHDGTRPVNPWGADLISGGSSSGSAVAVAAGLVDFAIGSDTAGSLRIPAQACGVASYKPSYGLLSLEGAMPLAPSLDCLGFLARDVALLQRIGAVLTPSHQDQIQIQNQAPSLYWAEDCFLSSVPEIGHLHHTMLGSLDKQGIAGRTIPLADLMQAADAPLFTVLDGEAYQSFLPLLQAGLLPETLSRRLQKGARYDAEAWSAARHVGTQLYQHLMKRLPEDACLIVPAMPCLTPTHRLCTPGTTDFSAKALYALSAFTRLASLLGLPVVTLPVAQDGRGAPLAVQVIGHRGQDAYVLAMAKRVQDACGFVSSAYADLRGNA